MRARRVAMRFWVLAAMFATVVAGAALPGGIDPGARKRRIEITEHYVREFEREVELQRGGAKAVWRNKREATSRMKQLKLDFPDDPQVQALFLRMQKAVMKSKGEWTEVDPKWTAYLGNEESLRKMVWAAGEGEWRKILDSRRGNVLEKAYPAPDSEKIRADELSGKLVVLDDVEYPAHQLYGATGEYVFCGKPSTGFWFVNIGGRDWLGPYEAVKRYRRNVDSGLADVKKWTILGEIAGVTAENPRPGEDAVGNVEFGWVVRPVALMVPGRVVAVADREAEASGRFFGEERVEEIKNGWYTVKSIPPDVTPERLMEIFMTAIKEKNHRLYLECIDPVRRGGDWGEDMADRYFWDLHQERFHGEYVHSTFGKAKVTVVQGYDDSDDDDDNFFLTDEQKAKVAAISGDKIEEAVVESTAFDRNGKQLGTPHPHKLIRRNGGRWYVSDYELRF